MNSQIKSRRMKRGDEAKVSEFISIVFNEYVAPGFSQDGIDEFMKYIKPDTIQSQLKENHFGFIATLGRDILGIIEVCNNNHIALFFVDGRFQRKGIGKKLLQKALELCSKNDSNFSNISVNATPNSIREPGTFFTNCTNRNFPTENYYS
ncbi:GNAT family N-acetyltransferase [uncultured Desulfosarcina sp.]|uniref:GNAT family N-acetyltransferase n=1 Tax=uncultured Desulfosarcina sp. TaxID=218289 RepID=UPI0029C8A540|nr:GNAT family N-acetyltransferase [uncultured Desulfosarcina sp.]